MENVVTVTVLPLELIFLLLEQLDLPHYLFKFTKEYSTVLCLVLFQSLWTVKRPP